MSIFRNLVFYRNSGDNRYLEFQTKTFSLLSYFFLSIQQKHSEIADMIVETAFHSKRHLD